jgi:hypothetical protein
MLKRFRRVHPPRRHDWPTDLVCASLSAAGRGLPGSRSVWRENGARAHTSF